MKRSTDASEDHEMGWRSREDGEERKNLEVLLSGVELLPPLTLPLVPGPMVVGTGPRRRL